MTYKVVAPVVLAVDFNGQTHHVYAGGVIDWLSDEQKAFFLADGLVVTDEDTPADGDGPHAAATKAELIAWLVDHAVRPDGSHYTAGSLQPMNKDDLRALIDDAVD